MNWRVDIVYWPLVAEPSSCWSSCPPLPHALRRIDTEYRQNIFHLEAPMQGSSKWRPGPREPPFFSRPSLNTTARSYSVTTCSQQMMISIDIVLYDLEAEEHGEGEGEDDDHPGDGLQHHAHQPQPGVADVAWRSYWSFTDMTKTILTRQYWHWDFGKSLSLPSFLE